MTVPEDQMDWTIVDPNQQVGPLLELWKGTRERIAERRSYEWKIAFGVWAAQLLAMGELVSHSASITRAAWLLFGFYLGAGLFVASLHWVYLRCFLKTRSNEEGWRAGTYEYEAAKRVMGAGAPGPPSPPCVKNSTGTAAHYFELGLTFALAVIGPLAVLAVAPSSAFH